MTVGEQVAVEQAVLVVGGSRDKRKHRLRRAPVCSRVVGGLNYRVQGVGQQVR